MEPALTVFYDLRERGLEKAPATSELLNWLEALEITGTKPEDLPYAGILLKRTSDILKIRGEKNLYG